MQTLWQDLLFGARMLRTKPSFTFIAVLTLALGIGANTAIFSVINAVLLRPLPYRDAERLAMVWESSPKDTAAQLRVSVPDFNDWRQQSTVFEEMGAFAPVSFNLTAGGEPEQIEGQIVSSSFFSLLGKQPSAGRGFLPAEDKSGQGRVVVLSYGLWQRRFGGDPSLIGRALALSGESYTVVGVMPRDFRLPDRADFWIPLGYYSGNMLIWRATHPLSVMGRLKPGVSLERAQAEMDATARRIWAETPLFLDWGVKVVPLTEQLYGDVRLTLLVLWAAVSFVLLIACSNIANLLLARGAARQKEIAIRTALGAGRMRLVRQLLTESLWLALLGGSAGVLLALWSMDAVRRLVPPTLPQLNEITMDGTVLGYTLVIALLTSLIFGLGPAFGATRVDLNQTLKEGTKGSMGLRPSRLRRVLVVAEVALSLLLLIGAALLIKSFVRLQQVDPGLRPENTLTLRLTLPPTQYAQAHQRTNFFRQLSEKITALPAVKTVGVGSSVPFSSLGTNSYVSVFIEGRPTDDPRQTPNAGLRMVNENYFSALGTRLVRGRAFTAADAQDAPWVAVINEAMARRFWPDSDPIGARIRDGASPDFERWATIVGIVADVKNRGLHETTAQEIYIPYQQRPVRSLAVIVHTASDPMTLLPSIRQQIAALDPAQPIYSIATMSDLVGESLALPNLSMLLLGGLAGLALLLAAVGIYGVISYAVSQRTHEIGIRMALGAQRRDVLKLVVGQGLTLTVIGIAIGLLAALGLTRLMTSLLFGVSANDPLTYLLVPLLLLGVALLACYFPARRAMKVDPMVALRYE